MTKFSFTALREGGEKFQGEHEAQNRQQVIEWLRQEGASALQVSPSRGRLGAKSLLSMQMKIPFLSGVPQAEKILFARNLSAMIAAGLPISRSLSVLEKQTRNAAMKQTLVSVGDEIKQGHTLHDALSLHPKVFAPIFIAMARAGEESGTLAGSLQVVAGQMEKAHALTKKVRGAMIYPAIVVIVMIAIFIMMLIFVVPTLASTFAGLKTALPLPTQIIIALSNALIAHSISISAAVIAGIIAFVFGARTTVGKMIIDRGVLAFPIIGGIATKINAARTARTLSSLLAAGVSALKALEITQEVVQNSRFRPVIADARASVEKGKPISDAFVRAEKIYPVMFAEMAAVGEETGDLSGMLARVADFYEGEVEDQTKDLSTIIEPILMVIIGAGVGFFAIAMIMPIYSLSNSIS